MQKTVFTKQAPIAAFPAYVVMRREADHTGFVNFTCDDTMGLDSGRGYWSEYSPGSVASYALAYNECPIFAVERAKERGHDLHWINANGTALTAHKQAQHVIVEVTIGMHVRFEGRLFTIEAASNNNLKFVPIV